MEKYGKKKIGAGKGQFLKKKALLKREKDQAARRTLESMQQDSEDSSPTLGRDIVEPALLGKQMWCRACHIPLSFDFTTKKLQRGAASIYTINCFKCNKAYSVHTSSTFGEDRSKLNTLFAINAKVGMGMIDAGIGESQLNSFLSAINVSTPGAASLKRYERVIGKVIDQVALDSCNKSLEMEIAMTEKANDIIKDNTGQGKKGLSFAFDVGWQERSKAYNSNSGHGALIGHRSGKICSFLAFSKSCRMCEAGNPASKHNCQKNYQGSSKGMEPEMAIRLFTQNPLLDKHNAFGARLIMDNDSSTIAGLRKVSKHPIELWADKNHSVKSFTSSLYALNLSKPLIEYFKKTLSLVIEKYKNKEAELKAAFEAIVPHAFGDHSLCKFHEEKENYVYKNLPNQKPIQGEQLKTTLNDLMAKFIYNVHKIAPAASTQANESFNNTVASFCPKSKHYSRSDSFSTRVGAAVCQKNIGPEYIEEIYETIKLSPSSRSARYRKIKQTKSIKKKLFNSTKEGKLRRKLLKKKKASKNVAQERREGITYQSDVGLSNSMDIAVDLPSPLNDTFVYAASTANNFKFVYFDTETTGLGNKEQICQLAAFDGNSYFNAYIVPTVVIKPKAAQITGFSIRKGELYQHGKKLSTVSREAATGGFLNYLRNLNETQNGTNAIILVGHNVWRFDAPKIEQEMKNFNLFEDYTSLVYGYCDTLDLFRKFCTDRKREKKSFAEEALAKDFLPNENLNSLHDALEDIKILKKLVNTLKISEQTLKNGSKSIESMHQLKLEKTTIERNKATLQIFKDKITANIINKMAKEGINKSILIKSYKANPKDGIKLLLSINVNKKARVTSKDAVINVITEEISKICHQS